MTNLVKLCVGAESVDDLRRSVAQRARRAAAEGLPRDYPHVTRSRPRLADDIIAGKGSLYWVVKGSIACRQRILSLTQVEDEDGRPKCRIGMALEVVATRLYPMRPFQGWRYLPDDKCPPDASQADVEDAMPPEMSEELRRLGLL